MNTSATVRSPAGSLCILILMSVTAIHPSFAADQFLANGTFESPVIEANTLEQVTPTGWAWGSRTTWIGWIFNGSAGLQWPLPPEGQQFVDIGDYPGIWLDQEFVVTSGGTYLLRWKDNTAVAPGHSTSPYNVAILDGSGDTLLDSSHDAYHAGAWQPQSLEVNLASGPQVLRFHAQGVLGWLDTLLDDVRLVGPIGDLNDDGVVDGADLGVLLASWGPCIGAPCVADLDGDNDVDGGDLGMLLAAWSG